MRIQTEYMSFQNCWRICSSYDFQAHQQHSQTRRFSQTAVLWFKVLPDLLLALPDLSSALPGLALALPSVSPALAGAPRCSHTYHNHSHVTLVTDIRDPSHSDGRPECPPRVWYSPDIDPSKFSLHILSDTPGVFQWLKYILLMQPYTLPWPPLGWLKPVLSTHGDTYQEICPRKSQSWQLHNVQFRRLCRQTPWSTMEVSH